MKRTSKLFMLVLLLALVLSSCQPAPQPEQNYRGQISLHEDDQGRRDLSIKLCGDQQAIYQVKDMPAGTRLYKDSFDDYVLDGITADTLTLSLAHSSTGNIVTDSLNKNRASFVTVARWSIEFKGIVTGSSIDITQISQIEVVAAQCPDLYGW